MALRVFAPMAGGATVQRTHKSAYVVDEDRGTAEAGTATTITLQAGRVSSIDDIYVGQYIATVSGTGVLQLRPIGAYVGATRVATVGPAWAVNPDISTGYRLIEADTFATFCCRKSSANARFGIDRIARLLGEKARESLLNGATS